MENFLHSLYYNIDSPVAFSGVNSLYAFAKRIKRNITLKNERDFLNKQHTHTIHKQTNRKFKRNKVVAVGKDSHWQADLMDMQKVSGENSGYNYILNVIDVLSKHAFSEPVKRKTAENVANAFKIILKRSGRKPWYLYVDKGSEFKGAFKRFVEANEINLYAAESTDIKASNAERYNRTLRSRLYKFFTANKTLRYINVLQRIVKAINNSVSRPLGARPVDVTFANEQHFWKRLYGDFNKKPTKFHFRTGDLVRIKMGRSPFHRGYLPQFSETTFFVTEVLARNPPVYRIEDARDNEPILGVFHHQELVPANKL